MQKVFVKKAVFPFDCIQSEKPDKFLISKTEQTKWQMMICLCV